MVDNGVGFHCLSTTLWKVSRLVTDKIISLLAIWGIAWYGFFGDPDGNFKTASELC